MKILDVGGGYGTPWMRVWESIPAGCQILMLDKDSKGREYLKNFIRENGHRLAAGVSFQFWDADAEEVSYEKEKYEIYQSLMPSQAVTFQVSLPSGFTSKVMVT